MGWRMRNFNILEVHRKIRVLGRGFMKKPIYREDCLEWGGGGGGGEEGGGGIFEAGLIPQCTLRFIQQKPLYGWVLFKRSYSIKDIYKNNQFGSCYRTPKSGTKKSICNYWHSFFEIFPNQIFPALVLEKSQFFALHN